MGTVVLCLMMLSVVFLRMTTGMTLVWDVLISLLLVMIYKSIEISDKIQYGMEYIGRHSFNIFLFHTFIYAFFFPAAIYWSRNPIIIFFSLLISCLVISAAIEKLKEYIGFYKL